MAHKAKMMGGAMGREIDRALPYEMQRLQLEANLWAEGVDRRRFFDEAGAHSMQKHKQKTVDGLLNCAPAVL